VGPKSGGSARAGPGSGADDIGHGLGTAHHHDIQHRQALLAGQSTEQQGERNDGEDDLVSLSADTFMATFLSGTAGGRRSPSREG
jgi:hypothetical protein